MTGPSPLYLNRMKNSRLFWSAALACCLAAAPAVAGVKKVIRIPGGSVQRALPFDAAKPVVRKVGKAESLRFLLGVPSAVIEPLTFRVLVKSGWRSRVVFEKTYEPTELFGWLDGAADLAPYEGKDVRLTFECRDAKGALQPALWAGLRFGNFTRAPGEYNVILISLDTLRADHLGIHGYERETSKNIDALGRGGVYFRQGIAASSWTKPSHATMLTGVHPSSHRLGFRPKQEGGFTKLSPEIITLAEILQARNYVTGAFAGGGNVSFVHGFDRGFDLFQERRKTEGHDAVPNFRAATEWMTAHKDDRFFLFVHTFEIHEPYEHNRFFVQGMTKTEGVSARYDGGIWYTDRVVGDFIEQVAKLGLEESTLIVLTSDHGDELWEHGYTNSHGHSVYDDLLRVPFLFHNPARIKPRIIDGFQVGHVDLAPTILDFVGAPRPEVYQGESLVPILEGGDIPTSSTAYSELEFYNGGTLRIPKRQMKSLRLMDDGGEYKLIMSPSLARGKDAGKSINASNHRLRVWLDLAAVGGRQVYDLKRDPKEQRNIAQQNPGIVARLEAEMDRYTAVTDNFFRPVEKSDEPITRELKDQLRSLGY